ncbi:hypothetical protein PAEPH01_0168 [Pancytospora epiphaga]|nr:hypothetical protein PAEPH01_0168 [Pancytospora epiphaga]
MAEKIPRKEYLNKSFDYKKLTKQELRRIMSENHVENIPGPNSLKNTILDAYKKYIHDRVDELASKFSNENIFQGSSASVESDLEATEEILFSGKGSESEEFAIDDSKYNTSINNSKYDNTSINNSKYDDISINNSKIINEEIHDSINDSILPNFSFKDKNFEINLRSPRKSKLMDIKLSNNAEQSSTPGNRDDTIISNSSIQTSIFDTSVDSENISVSRSRKGGVIKTMPNTDSTTPNPVSSRFKRRYLLAIFILMFLVYLKFFCPYCTPEGSFCVPLPAHSLLVNEEICCAPGYRLVRGIIDHCVVDNTEKLRNIEKAGKIIRMLEYYKGEEKYGTGKNRRIKLDNITLDQELQRLVLESGKVTVEGGYVTAIKGRRSVRVVIRYYLRRIALIAIPFLFFLVTVKLCLNRRRRQAKLLQEAHAIAKDVLGTLSRQLVVSTRSSVFNPELSERQLKDALDVPEQVWCYVVPIVRSNANVKCVAGEDGEAMWVWKGPILSHSE